VHPFIVQSIAAERVKDLHKTAQRNRDARQARDRGLHRRRALRAACIARQLGFPLTSNDPGQGRVEPTRPAIRA
jgi:hypothetical protein